MSSFKTTSEIFASPFALPQELELRQLRLRVDHGRHRQVLRSTRSIVVGCALVIVMVLGSMCAYVLARYSFFGSRVIYYLMLAGLTFPVFLAIVPLFFVLQDVGLLNTLPGLIVTYVAFALPFTVFFLFPFFKALPDEIAEAAEIDGAGEWRTFFQVMLPMAQAGDGVGRHLQLPRPVEPVPAAGRAEHRPQDNYVLSQGMAAFASQAGYNVDFGRLFAAVVITVVPVLIVYVIFQRQLQGSVTAGHAEVGGASPPRDGCLAALAPLRRSPVAGARNPLRTRRH